MSSALRRFLAIGVLVLCALTTGELLRAYALVGVTWGTSTVRYYVNPRSKWVSENAAISAVQTAAATWNQSAANIELVYAGTTTGTTVGMNYKSEVIFRDASSGSSAGSGYYWYDSSGKIVDGDVVVWEGAHQFFAGSGCVNGIYIENVVAHELGHTLGLGHSSVGAATMYPSMQGACDRSWLTLDADDIAGIEKAYPPLSGGTPSNTAPAVSIASPAANSSYATTTAITFSGSASDSQDGNLTSNLRWTSNLVGQIGSGGSFSRALPAGVHLITALASDKAGLVGSQAVTVTVADASPSPPPPAPLPPPLPPPPPVEPPSTTPLPPATGVPSAPANLQGAAIGSYLSLAWQNTSAGGAPTSLLLEVEGSIVAALPLGVTETFSFDGVPTATLTFTVRAVNASGMSAPSNPVTLTFPGSTSCAAPPLPPSNVAATTSGTFVSMTWQPPQGGAMATSYVVNVTGSFTGQLPTVSLGIAGTVAPGTYVVTVQAVNPCGASAASAPVTITVG